MHLRQYLLVLFLAYTGAFEPPCCKRVTFRQNETTMNCKSRKNNYLDSMCPPGLYGAVNLKHLKISFSENNSLLMKHMNGLVTPIKKGRYCFLDEFDKNTSTKISQVVFCGEKIPENPYRKILSICTLVSACFYLLTAIIYILLPPIRDQLGLSIINFCVAIGLGHFMLAYMNLVSYTIWDRDHGFCAARGFLAYFFLVAAFFWFNVISIQTLRGVRNPSSATKDGKIFWYAVYGWGVPVILTSIMAVVNFLPGDHAKPGIGLNTCFFITLRQKWYYLYSVMTILISVNAGIFVYVSVVMWCSVHFTSDHARDVRKKFSLTWKLCLLMGLPWILEMISSLIKNADTIEFILDVFTMTQGVVIFLVLVVLRKRTLRAMHKSGWFLCLSGAFSTYLNKSNDVEADIVPQTNAQDVDIQETVVDK